MSSALRSVSPEEIAQQLVDRPIVQLQRATALRIADVSEGVLTELSENHCLKQKAFYDTVRAKSPTLQRADRYLVIRSVGESSFVSIVFDAEGGTIVLSPIGNSHLEFVAANPERFAREYFARLPVAASPSLRPTYVPILQQYAWLASADASSVLGRSGDDGSV